MTAKLTIELSKGGMNARVINKKAKILGIMYLITIRTTNRDNKIITSVFEELFFISAYFPKSFTTVLCSFFSAFLTEGFLVNESIFSIAFWLTFNNDWLNESKSIGFFFFILRPSNLYNTHIIQYSTFYIKIGQIIIDFIILSKYSLYYYGLFIMIIWVPFRHPLNPPLPDSHRGTLAWLSQAVSSPYVWTRLKSGGKNGKPLWTTRAWGKTVKPLQSPFFFSLTL